MQKFNPRLEQRLSPPRFSREPPSAERAGRAESTQQLPVELRRVQISLDFPDPGQLQRWLQGWAGLTNSRGSAQTQHPSVTGLCPAPPTPHGHLEGSGLALGSHRSSPVPKPVVQPSPRATGAAQPGGGCHCTSNGSVHTRRDKEGHSDGELTLSSPRLPAQLTPRSQGEVGHPLEENPPSHHGPSTNSQVLTHSWSSSMSS